MNGTHLLPREEEWIAATSLLHQTTYPAPGVIPTSRRKNLPALVLQFQFHQKKLYGLNLIFWIVMGCGIARFGDGYDIRLTQVCLYLSS